MACGRRWGKTAVGLIAVIDGHGAWRGQYRGGLGGKRIWWVVPSYGDATEVWRDLKRATEMVATKVSEVGMRIDLPGGGSITVKSADNPDALRGRGLDGVVVDEAAFCNGDTWHRALRPALADRLGWAILMTTPNGLNWFNDLFDAAGTDSEWATFQRPTSDNPLVSAKELASARRAMGDAAFLQEHEALFISIDGAEFPGEYFGDELFVGRMPSGCYAKVVALDPSKGKHAKRGDYQAAVAVGVWESCCYVDAVLQRVPVGQAVDATVALAMRYGCRTIAYEANNFQELLGAEFERRLQGHRFHGITVLPIVNTANKEGRIQSLDPFLRNRELRFVDSPGTRLLLQQLKEFPMAAHDDGPDALEMAIRTSLAMLNHDEQPANPVQDILRQRGFV